MNGTLHPGSQPSSINSGSVTAGGFEMIATGMAMGGVLGMSPPGSTVGGLSMTDVTLEQALARMHELARENGELREFLKENNEMMKKQFETLLQWKQKVHDANVMNREKFEQTRSLITALRAENEESQISVRDKTKNEELLLSKLKLLETELNTLKTAKAASDQLAFNVVTQAKQQGVEVGDEETEMTETVYVASAEKENHIMELEADLERKKEELEQIKERYSHLEHDNQQFRSNTEQLLKDLESTQQLKQQIQRENQDLRQETVELQRQLQTMLAESKNSMQKNQNLKIPLMSFQQPTKVKDGHANIPIPGNTGEGAMGQTPDRTVDDWQETSAAVTEEVEQLQKQLAAEKLQKETLCTEVATFELQNSQLQDQIEQLQKELEKMQTRHEDRIRQLQKEHESHVEHLGRQTASDSSFSQQQVLTATHAEDVHTLRSQVLTLINEVHETQNKLTAAQRVIDTKNARVKELEAYSSQMFEESRNRVQQLQNALAMGERQFLAEHQDHVTTKRQMNDLRKSFNQLVSDYKELLDTFDSYKMGQEQQNQSYHHEKKQMDNISQLTAQLVAAEEAINMREERISKYEAELRERDETAAVLLAQAEVFKADFLAERDSRSKLATDKEQIAQELEAEQLKSQGLMDQLTRYTQQQLQDMQLRASQGSAGGNYFHPNYNFRTEAGRGGDGMNRGNFNNLSAGERAQAQGLNYGRGGQHFTGGQHYGRGLGQYPGVQHYIGGQNFAGAGHEGYPHQRPGHLSQTTYSGNQYVDVHSQYTEAKGGGGSQPSQHDEEEQPLFICPSCGQHLPDYDTLAIHVQDCLEQNAPDSARS